jgi:hypothetical protein
MRIVLAVILAFGLSLILPVIGVAACAYAGFHLVGVPSAKCGLATLPALAAAGLGGLLGLVFGGMLGGGLGAGVLGFGDQEEPTDEEETV